MDTFSHAAWGWAMLRRRGRPAAWMGALMGALPDLLFFVPSKIEQIAEGDFEAVHAGGEPGIWKAGGPPLPPALVEAYNEYYVWTHSLLVFAAGAALLWALAVARGPRAPAGRVARGWTALWLAAPYLLHILMDIPTHERYLVKAFYPLSDWTFLGLSWGDPRIFWPHLAVLVAVLVWVRRRERARERAAAT